MILVAYLPVPWLEILLGPRKKFEITIDFHLAIRIVKAEQRKATI